jgi:hypothetical protein
MKLEIDTENKKIIIKESINIMELINELQILNIDTSEYELDVAQNYPYYPPINVPYTYTSPSSGSPNLDVTLTNGSTTV